MSCDWKGEIMQAMTGGLRLQMRILVWHGTCSCRSSTEYHSDTECPSLHELGASMGHGSLELSRCVVHTRRPSSRASLGHDSAGTVLKCRTAGKTRNKWCLEGSRTLPNYSPHDGLEMEIRNRPFSTRKAERLACSLVHNAWTRWLPSAEHLHRAFSCNGQ